MTEQLQWMPFVNVKLHEPFVKFIYWSLRQLDAGTQVINRSLSSTIMFSIISFDLVLSIFFACVLFIFQDFLLPLLYLLLSLLSPFIYLLNAVDVI